ncbi:MAG: glycosyltransferase [Alphaproteobacteria bacterium]
MDRLPTNLFICVEGLFEKGDSIGFDAIYHWRVLHDLFGSRINVRLFCARLDKNLHSDIPAEPIDELTRASWDNRNTVVIYHYCDGWPDIEELLLDRKPELVVRWHNNTPPWFFARYGKQFVDRTIRGYRRIIGLAEANFVRVWCNSRYSARQLEVLGIRPEKLHVVYPASGYLMGEAGNGGLSDAASVVRPSGNYCKLLFVGRIVPHKGHRHLLATAGCLQEQLGLSTEVICPGRIDSSLRPYADHLRELAAQLSVKLYLPGEVDKGELNQLYRDADAFVCLSEHEGFGLPIFEAMRSGLPTVALKQTAIAELLGTYPLAFSEFTAAQFAAAIVALQDVNIRSYILRYQNDRILPQYTNSIVVSQIRQGLNSLFPVPDAGTPEDLPPAPCANEEFNDNIKEQIRYLTKRAANYSHQVLSELPCEIPSNFMTRYDLEAYEEFTSIKSITFDEQTNVRGVQRPAYGRGEDRRIGILIPASRFSTMEGPLPQSAVTVPLNTEHDHLIFGPYIPIPKGMYSVDFQVELIDCENDPAAGRLRFDIADSGRQLCQKVLSLKDLKAGVQPTLEFIQEKNDASIEFRISTDRCPAGAMRFRGIVLGRLGSMTYIAEQASTYGAPRPVQIDAARSKRRRIWRVRSNHAQLVAATEAFVEADRARDQRDWSSAAHLYGKGLELDPDNFAMWVQYGHSLKHSDRFTEAEIAYRRAIDLCPENADINLQMGHLMKIQGRLSEAVIYYTRASNLAPPAGQFAREELVKCGVLL